MCNLLVFQVAASTLQELQLYESISDTPLSPLDLCKELTRHQLLQAKADSLMNYAEHSFLNTADTSTSNTNNLVAHSSGTTSSNESSLYSVLQRSVNNDFNVLQLSMPKTVIRASSNTDVTAINCTDLWQHLTTAAATNNGQITSSQRAQVMAHVKTERCVQIRMLPSNGYPRLQYGSLFIAVAQVLSSTPVVVTNSSGSVTNRLIPNDWSNGLPSIMQLALQMFAACLAHLGGAVNSGNSGNDSSTVLYIDADYVQSVFSAYGVDDTLELINSLWSGTVDVHPILVGLLTRILPIQLRV
jgi:hypothetical protein